MKPDELKMFHTKLTITRVALQLLLQIHLLQSHAYATVTFDAFWP